MTFHAGFREVSGFEPDSLGFTHLAHYAHMLYPTPRMLGSDPFVYTALARIKRTARYKTSTFFNGSQSGKISNPLQVIAQRHNSMTNPKLLTHQGLSNLRSKHGQTTTGCMPLCIHVVLVLFGALLSEAKPGGREFNAYTYISLP